MGPASPTPPVGTLNLINPSPQQAKLNFDLALALYRDDHVAVTLALRDSVAAKSLHKVVTATYFLR